ncbi:TrmJ/YjtD family RNA methyltransferase [Candidatus Woesearchaeota archaeon]|nr:TrmJ/YjtD family RNA methyltransferase [Candidatus Woesearchaeota archaeon]
MIELILIEPRKQENLGAVARVMANFDFSKLTLINPKCKIGKTSRKVAKHANKVLDKTKIKDFDYLKKFDYLIGTTAILGTDYNIPRNPINPEQVADKLVRLNKKIRIALIVGREGQGLSNEEIDLCDILVTIPASKTYPTLNISHAVSILLFEIFKKSSSEKSNSHINFATKKEKEVIMKYINNKLKSMDFATKEKLGTQRKVWKRLLGKSMMTKREAFALMGFLRKLK